MVVWVPFAAAAVAAVAAAATAVAGAGAAASGSPKPVGVEGSGGVWRLLSIGLGACWDVPWRGLVAAGLGADASFDTAGDICDWLMSPHWISTLTGFDGWVAVVEVTACGC